MSAQSLNKYKYKNGQPIQICSVALQYVGGGGGEQTSVLMHFTESKQVKAQHKVQ